MRLTAGQRLALWRRREGMSQFELAAKHGVSQPVVHRWEADQLEMPRSLRRKVSRLRPTVGERAYLRRRELGLTIREAAEACGLSHVSVIAYERDRWPPEEYYESLETL